VDLAILFQLVVNLVSGLALGIAFGPDVMFFFCTGLLLVLAVIVVYTMANIGVFFFYRREHPREFNVFSHVLVPVFATASLLYLLYKSFDPMPASPYKYSPEIIGGWLLLGIAILIYARRTGRDAWALGAGQALAEDLEPVDLRGPVPPVSAAVVGESPEGA
jgi:amino acid transporter